MSATFEQLVVALGSPSADRALITFASVLAHLGGSRVVHFVHVAREGADVTALRDDIRAAVAAAAPELSGRTEVDVVRGALTDRLLAYVTEAQADLIVVGGRRRRLAARLAMLAPCAVAMLPDGVAPAISHLLVAVDFSHDAADTLRWATSLAAADPSVRCTALHVMTHESTDLFADDETLEARTAAMRELLADARQPGVSVTPRLVDIDRDGTPPTDDFPWPSRLQPGDVAHTILTQVTAAGADCLALSTRGRSRSAAILLGSVAEIVIEHATVPLLVGKPAGRRLSLVDVLLGRAGAYPAVKTS